MPDYGVTMRDASDFGKPKWPWFIVVIILVAGGSCLLLRKNADKDGKPADATEEILPPIDVAPASASNPSSSTTATAPAPATQPATPVPAETLAKIDAAFRLADDDKLADARAALLAMLDDPSAAGARARIESRLGEINIELITTPHAMPEKIDYAIAAGDQIRAIARKHGTTRDLVCKSNDIHNPDIIKVGDRLRILNNVSFAILVNKTTNDLLLTMNGKFFKRYVVSTGKYGKTPVGTFKITVKEVEPIWYIDGRQIPFGDKENILGTRWMALEATGDTMPASGYGIHGTWDPDSLGKQASAGCVRMRNSDVEELFMIVPEGTPVTIVE